MPSQDWVDSFLKHRIVKILKDAASPKLLIYLKIYGYLKDKIIN